MNNKKTDSGLFWFIAAMVAVLIGAAIRAKVMEVEFFFTHDDDWAVFGTQALDMLNLKYFRAFMYRQSYMGIAPLGADMIFSALIGPTRTALGAASMFYWGCYLVCIFFLAKTIFDCVKTAALSLMCAALMPAASFFLCPQPARGYLDNFCLGLIIFIITLKIISSDKERPGLWALLGLIGGISFWTSFYAGYFLVPVFFLLLLSRPAIIITPYPYLSLICFTAGSTPVWVYNFLTHEDCPTFGVFGSGGRSHPVLESLLIYIGKLKIVLGLDFSTASNSLASSGALVVFTAACVLLVVHLIKADKKDFFKNRRNCGIILIILYMLMVSAANVSSSKYAGTSIMRYALPVYPFIHIAVGALLGFVHGKNKLLFVLAVPFWLTAQINSSWFNDARLHEPRIKTAHAKYLSMLSDITAFSRQHNVRFISTPKKWDAVNLDFDLASLPDAPRVVEPLSPMHADDSLEMDNQNRQFLLEPYSRAPLMKSFLDSQGFLYRTKKFTGSITDYTPDGKTYDYTLFYDLTRPAEKYSYVPTAAVRLRASDNNEFIDYATDRIINTRWTHTSSGTDSEQWIEIDCMRPTRLGKIVIDYKTNYRQYPSSLMLAVSDDGKEWETISEFDVIRGLYTIGTRIMERPLSGILQTEVTTQKPYRYYRLTNTAVKKGSTWSINELYLFTKQNTFAKDENPDISELVRLIKSKKIRQVYTDALISARLMPLTYATCFNEYPWDGNDQRRMSERRMDFSERTAIIVDESMAGEVCMLLMKNSLEFSRRTLGGQTFITVEQSTAQSNLFWLGFTAAGFFDSERSFELLNKGSREKDPIRQKQLLQDSLRFYPDNFTALRKLSALVPTVRYDHMDMLRRFLPKNRADIRFDNLVRIRGFTKDKDSLLVFADFIRDCGKGTKLLVYGLSGNDEKVVFAQEIRPTGNYPVWNNEHPMDRIYKGQRVVFRVGLPETKEKLQIWVAYLGQDRKRIDILRVNSEPYNRNRVLLTTIEPA